MKYPELLRDLPRAGTVCISIDFHGATEAECMAFIQAVYTKRPYSNEPAPRRKQTSEVLS